MRNLEAADIFKFCRVVKEIGIRDEIKRIAMRANNAMDVLQEDVGYEVLFSLFDKATEEKAEKALFEFFADIFEENNEAVAKMDPVEFIEKVFKAAEPKKWKVFFGRVASLMK